MTSKSQTDSAFKNRVQMIWQAKRLETFKNWPFGEDAPCSALKLAEAGFFFTGSSREPDAVQCFLCDKALDGWEEGDDPWAEHLSHSLNCGFAKLGQAEEALTFQQLSAFHKEQIEKQVQKGMQDIQNNTDKIFNARLAKLKKTLNSLIPKN